VRRGRAWLSAIALGAALSLAGAASQSDARNVRGVLLTPQAPFTRDLERATVDRADDIDGQQVHFLYVLPSDGTDRQLDTNGTLDASIARIQQWIVDQTRSLSLRVDTYQGAPDITFVRLPHSDAQATSTHPWPIWVIGEGLVAARFNDPDKFYAAFYDGRSTWACAGAKSPALPRLGAMYLQAWPTNDPRPCSDAPGFGTGLDRPGYFEIGLLHEVLHTMGFAPPCAPHLTRTDHVNDSPTDLMYHPDEQSPAPWDWPHAVLDFNRDDYFGDRVPSGCPNLRDSPVLARRGEPTPTVTLSVSWRAGGAIRLAPGGTYGRSFTKRFQKGARVTLVALPRRGFRFVRWSGSCRGTRARCGLTLHTSKRVGVVFARAQ
jgi:hypothetical protein